MKKVVIASIIASASLMATAQVSVYGLVREYVDYTKTNGVNSTKMVNDTSRVGLKAVESIGPGLTVRAVVETGFEASDPAAGPGTVLGDRQSTVGFATQSGSVDFGRKLNSYFTSVTSNDVFDTDYGSLAADIHSVRTVRSGNAVFLNYSLGPVAVALDRTMADVSPEAVSYSVSGKIGQVLTTVARFEQGDTRSTVLAGQTVFKGYGLYASSSVDSFPGGDMRGTLVGASRKLDNYPVLVKASYGVRTGDTRAYALGAEYSLSKRTSLNAGYRMVDSLVDVRQFGIGVSHAF